MTEPEVYLEKLSAFSRILRREGLVVSPMETADAGQILICMGLSDRERVKTALRTVFAKSREDQLAFDRAFDGFFLSEEAIKEQAARQREEAEAQARQRLESEQELQFNGKPMEFSPEQRDAYATLPREVRQRLQDITERYKPNLERNPGLYANFIHSVFAHAILEQQILLEDGAVGVAALDPELGLLYRDISQFRDTEIPRAIAILRDISRQINGALAARRKGRGYSVVLDFRRTIRKGLETGGNLYRLKYRKKRRRRRQIVMLCDVSGSMLQFSEFALRLIQSLGQASEGSRTFLFSENVMEADAFSLQNMDLFRSCVRDSGIYGKGTDLGTALEKLCAAKPSVLGPSTTLLILSDTKTIDQPRAAAAVLEAKRQAGRLLWLNPIPENKWKYIGSVQTMASLCQMVSCSTLKALASACQRLILE